MTNNASVKRRDGKLFIDDSLTLAPQFLFYAADPKLRKKVYQQIYGVNSKHVKVPVTFFTNHPIPRLFLFPSF